MFGKGVTGHTTKKSRGALMLATGEHLDSGGDGSKEKAEAPSRTPASSLRGDSRGSRSGCAFDGRLWSRVLRGCRKGRTLGLLRRWGCRRSPPIRKIHEVEDPYVEGHYEHQHGQYGLPPVKHVEESHLREDSKRAGPRRTPARLVATSRRPRTPRSGGPAASPCGVPA